MSQSLAADGAVLTLGDTNQDFLTVEHAGDGFRIEGALQLRHDEESLQRLASLKAALLEVEQLLQQPAPAPAAVAPARNVPNPFR